MIVKAHEDYLKVPDTKSVVHSFTLGETGILLLRCLWTNDAAQLDRLEQIIEANIRNPVNEALWGGPGTMSAALFLYKRLGTDLWKNLFLKNCDYLFETWNYKLGDCLVWQQDLYGKICRLAGAGHDFAGNVFPLLEGAELLSATQRNTLFSRTCDVVIKQAQIEGGGANWLPYFEGGTGKVLMQWCHGAPGFITSLISFPKNYSPELEKILVMGGEATWQAGPLNKGVGICHSTDGNGWAFLTLYKRTGDLEWLGRARAFAMHAITQRNGRQSLWTGEMGLATYLMACISLDERIPTLAYI